MSTKSHNKIIGEWGERLAAEFLERKGYSVIEKNCRASYKEIDLICRQEQILVFVEVKTRTNLCFGSAADMVGNSKINNLKQAAISYLAANRPKYDMIRIDFIAIDVDQEKGRAKIKHYKDIV
jgi:putative endonuclease